MSQSGQKPKKNDFFTSSDQKMSGFDRPHVFGFLAYSKISPLKNVLEKLWIHRVRVDERRIRQEMVTDSKISGFVWTGGA